MHQAQSPSVRRLYLLNRIHRSASPRLLAVIAAVAIVISACGTSASPSSGASPTGSSAAPTVSFTGRTVTIINNFPPGGPSDLLDRLVARFLPNHLAGHPTVIVQDMPGASGEIGVNYLYHAKPDGTVIGGFSDPVSPVMVQDPGVQYSLGKLGWVAGVEESCVIFARSNTGAHTAAGLLQSKVPLVFGGYGQSSSFDLRMRAFLNALSVPYKYVTGYNGAAPVLQAFRAGETNVEQEAVSGYFALVTPMVKQGLATPLGEFGFVNSSGAVVPDPRAKAWPTAWQLIKRLRGKAPSGPSGRVLKWMIGVQDLTRTFNLPAGTPPRIQQVVNEAFAATFADPAFVAAAKKEFQIHLLTVGGAKAKELATSMVSEMNAHPRAAALLVRMAGTHPPKP